MLVQYNAVPVYIYVVTGLFRLDSNMLMCIWLTYLYIVYDRYNVYIYILTSDILFSHACHAKGYTIYSLVVVLICT